jgi:hypothetical protein
MEFFVPEVIARLAVNILGIQPNSAALFYRKIREVIAYYLEQESHEIFDGIGVGSSSELIQAGSAEDFISMPGKAGHWNLCCLTSCRSRFISIGL